jgi:ubiquinone biosynthesis protein UbiJ
MNEMAIFNEWIAEELQARGFRLVGKSSLAWFFEDSARLERIVSELTAALMDDDKYLKFQD